MILYIQYLITLKYNKHNEPHFHWNTISRTCKRTISFSNALPNSRSVSRNILSEVQSKFDIKNINEDISSMNYKTPASELLLLPFVLKTCDTMSVCCY